MNEVENAIGNLAEAENSAAIGDEFAADFIEIKGVKLFYKQFAHAWVLPRLGTQQYAELDDLEKVLCMAYILAHEQSDVRNRIAKEIRTGVILECAWNWAEKHNILPEDISGHINALMLNPYEGGAQEESKKRQAATPGATTGGAA